MTAFRVVPSASARAQAIAPFLVMQVAQGVAALADDVISVNSFSK
ncbi:MAG: hypothetical protein P3W97_005210 [Tepidimonas sp.]|nr:hypothetical protein [Tepidimonas sp.]MDM7456648.1 hypothetical protein [Tepidimonas sp.]